MANQLLVMQLSALLEDLIWVMVVKMVIFQHGKIMRSAFLKGLVWEAFWKKQWIKNSRHKSVTQHFAAASTA